MNRLLDAVLACFLLVASAPAAFAELTPEKKQSADALIRDLGVKDLAAREQAVDKLVALGPDVLPLIKATLAATRDAEVKFRCEMVVTRLSERYLITADGKVTDLSASKVSVDAKDAPLAEVVKTLARQSGNKPFILADDVKDLRVSLAAKDMPYWQAVDALCESAGLIYDQGWQEDGRHLVKFDAKTQDPAAHTGPVVVRVTRVDRQTTRSQSRVFRAAGQNRDPVDRFDRYIMFNAECQIEDRLPVLSGQLRFTRALTRDGVNRLPPEQVERENRGMGRRMGWPSYFMNGYLRLSAAEDPEMFDAPVTLEGVAEIELVAGRRELKLDGILGDKEKKAAADGMELTLTKAERKGVDLVVTLTVSGDGKVPTYVAPVRGYDYGFVIVDGAGTRYREFTNCIWKSDRMGMQGGSGVGYRLDAMRGPFSGTLTLTVQGVPDAPGDWSVVFQYPEKTETREYPFSIREVPVP